MKLTTQQRQAFVKGQQAANDELLRVEYLEKMAEVYPPIREAVQELRTRREYLHQLCTVALDNAS